MSSSTKHAEIGNTLTQEILAGNYQTGERLPSERNLAERFNANRGAVREAMKQLQQLGLADIQPGGARVLPLASASLNIVGQLLRMQSPPNATLIDQLMLVMHSLVRLAAETTVAEADSAKIQEIRAKLKPLLSKSLDPAKRLETHITVLNSFMRASGNLPLQLISNSLLEHLAPALAPFVSEMQNSDEEIEQALALDTALAERNLDALRAAFEVFIDINRQAIYRSLTSVQPPSHQLTNGQLANKGVGGPT